ncbi:MAG: fibronectin type III domain-containing protein [Paludibacter sp.]|nr:fibronectin type III domain-containing protein [Paludibacter sp.]
MKKGLLIFGVMAVLMMLMNLQVFAAAAAPGNVKKLTAKAVSERSVQLSWNKVSKATGYKIFRVSLATGKQTYLGTTSNNSYTFKKVNVNTKYSFVVYAYKKSGTATVNSALPSPVASVTTAILTPNRPPKFRIAGYGNKSILLKWDAAKNATGYYVYMYKEKTRRFEKIAATRSTSCRISKLTAGVKYQFRVQAYRTVQKTTAVSKASDTVSGKAKDLSMEINSVHGRCYSATLRSKTTVTIVTTQKTKKLKAGTRILTTDYGRTGTITAYLTDGTKIKISGSLLNYNGGYYAAPNAFSKKTKEAFINARGYSSDTNYLVWVSQYTYTTNIFKGSKGEWELVRSMPCVIGKDGRSPVGMFELLFADSAYGGVQIYYTYGPQGGNSFHRRLDANVQAAVSLGCVRLGDTDLYYLYNTCPMGTAVLSY